MFNLAMIFLSIPLSLYFEFEENPEFHQQILEFSPNQMLVLYGFTIVVAGVFLILLWLFYRLIYGVLLKRLNRNYDELKKLEV